MDDLIILPDKDLKRKGILDQDVGKEVHSNFVNCDAEIGKCSMSISLGATYIFFHMFLSHSVEIAIEYCALV